MDHLNSTSNVACVHEGDEDDANVQYALRVQEELQAVLKLTDFDAYSTAVAALDLPDTASRDVETTRTALKCIHTFAFDVSFFPRRTCFCNSDADAYADAEKNEPETETETEIDAEDAERIHSDHKNREARILEKVKTFDFEITKSVPPTARNADFDAVWHIALRIEELELETPLFGLLLFRRNFLSGWRFHSERDKERSFCNIYCACFETEDARNACSLDWNDFFAGDTLLCPPPKPASTYADLFQEASTARAFLTTARAAGSSSASASAGSASASSASSAASTTTFFCENRIRHLPFSVEGMYAK